MEKKCKYCGQLIKYDKQQQLGGHIINCKKNPNKKNMIQKASNSRKIERLEYEFGCLRCGKKYEIILKKTDFEKKKYSMFCSRSCANKRIQSEKTKKNIGDSIKKRIRENGAFGFLIERIEAGKKKNIKEKPRCKFCGKEVNKHENIYCSKKCASQSEDVKKKISNSIKGKNSGKSNGMFGISPSHKKYKGGIYYSNKNKKEIKYRSSYELIAMEILEKDDNVLYYNYEPYNIKYRNGKRSTIIDFEIFYKEELKKIVEVKPKRLLNRWNNKEKIKAVKKYCKKNNIPFEVWTEKELNIIR